ncbi:WD40 repeat domain-containing protein [Deinococcus yavapaiensis]|uniref:WD domain G-beta repeat uncharacterized protein n=1 Tax=Deinococcus yavapaiensis KR-236 TaxID=694435 RepID=A0A318S6F2_9DEIO|nr:WD40 repeat domain-containing protein [Deinococcus yavapaiensis]PYE51994.1 WD domain G-beta repeat uncharacterized protein [Deinococcus yavapaiensis KR-236]
MPLPLIWVVAAVGVAAAKKGIDGGVAIKQARDSLSNATARKEAAERKIELRLTAVRERARSLEQQKLTVMGTSMAAFVRLWERQKQRANVTDKDFQVRLHLSPEHIEEFRGFGVQSLDVARGMLKAGAASLGAGMGVTSAVTALGAASTGTALSALSGAAANSALLAWLGGGTLASGGGGVALGTIVAGGLFAAPAALVGSLILAKKGEEARTAAVEYAANVDVYCAEVTTKIAHLRGIERRLEEVAFVVHALEERLVRAVVGCEEDEARSGGKVDLVRFFSAAQLARTLSQVMSVPIIAEDLQATSASAQLVAESSAQHALPLESLAVGGLVEEASDVPTTTSDVWAWADEVLELTLPQQGTTSVVFGEQPDALITASDRSCVVWSIEEARPLHESKEHTGTVNSVAVSRAGWFASASDDRTARVWNDANWKAGRRLLWNERYAKAVAFSPVASHLAVGYGDGLVKVYDVESGDERHTLTGHTMQVTAVAFDPLGRHVVSSSWDHSVRVHSLDSGALTLELKHYNFVHDVRWSADGRYLATASEDRTAGVWCADTGKRLLTLNWNRRYVYAVAFHPSAPLVATAFADGVVKLWLLPSGEEIASLGQPGSSVNDVTFSPDGRFLAAGGSDRIVVWTPSSTTTS